MGRDARVDAYIERQQDFAIPILLELRERVHAACPEAEEAIKWGMPAFVYRGAMLAGMAAFKAHATFGFWRGREVVGDRAPEGMGQFGKLRSVADLPDEAAFAAMVQAAAALIETQAKPTHAPRAPRAEPDMPPDLATVLAEAGAEAAFAAMTPGARREYLEWIAGAKRAETRAKRVATAVGQVSEGKKLHWKYEGC